MHHHEEMHHFFTSIFGLFLSPLGVLLLAALDSTMLFFLPAALDTAVIVMSARDKDLFWIYPLMAVIGSVIGSAITFTFGHKLGEPGLRHFIPEKKLTKVRHTIDNKGVVAMGMTAVLPPPFPLTPFVLTSGALGLDKRKFFLTLGAMRFLRFFGESLLAVTYGRRVLNWFQSEIFEYIIGSLMILAIIGTAVTIVQMVRKVR
jgi:membrane protein YqaA with SNARE-associated domain